MSGLMSLEIVSYNAIWACFSGPEFRWYAEGMRNLQSLSNEALLTNTEVLVSEERKLTTSILWHLHEIQRRRLHAEQGYGSLFEYAVRGLGYSEAAAGRRIAAMRLLVEVPEIESALESGSVSISTLCTVQGFFQRKDEPVSKEEKKELIFSLQGKSRRECEKALAAIDPAAALPQERERILSPTQTEIRFVADDALMEKLQKIRELDGHVQSDPTYLELFHRMADLVLKRLDPSTQKKARLISTPPAESAAPVKVDSRYVSAALKREVWKQDLGRCAYQSKDGRRCGSRFALEVDHVEPFALGGKTELSNLRLLCRAHNQQQAYLKFGEARMSLFQQGALRSMSRRSAALRSSPLLNSPSFD